MNETYELDHFEHNLALLLPLVDSHAAADLLSLLERYVCSLTVNQHPIPETNPSTAMKIIQ